MLAAYRQHAAERAALGIPPLPLDAKQTAALIELIKAPPAGEEAFLMDLLTHRVPPGVDDAAKVKASFLAAVAHGEHQASAWCPRPRPPSCWAPWWAATTCTR
jgi:aconitate hydratase 2/2-methylisocitrate dehydratase